jgi:hypothetical protein
MRHLCHIVSRAAELCNALAPHGPYRERILQKICKKSGRMPLSRVASCFPGVIVMPSRPRTRQSANTNPRAAASRSWRASLIRKRAQVLGDVQAPSREAAEAAAVREFNLSDEQRSRLVVQERG